MWNVFSMTIFLKVSPCCWALLPWGKVQGHCPSLCWRLGAWKTAAQGSDGEGVQVLLPLSGKQVSIFTNLEKLHMTNWPFSAMHEAEARLQGACPPPCHPTSVAERGSVSWVCSHSFLLWSRKTFPLPSSSSVPECCMVSFYIWL